MKSEIAGNLVDIYRRFGESFCLQLRDTWTDRYVIRLHYSHIRWQWLSRLLPWEPQIIAGWYGMQFFSFFRVLLKSVLVKKFRLKSHRNNRRCILWGHLNRKALNFYGAKIFWPDIADAKWMFPINLRVVESIKFETFMGPFQLHNYWDNFVHYRTRTF